MAVNKLRTTTRNKKEEKQIYKERKKITRTGIPRGLTFGKRREKGTRRLRASDWRKLRDWKEGARAEKKNNKEFKKS
jgi:hypothetical protein